MRFLMCSAVCLSAALIAAPSAVSAQAVAKPQAAAETQAIQYNPANWLFIETENGKNYVHKASGAICVDNFRDLKLAAIKDYAPDGSNSGCQYDKNAVAGLSRLTVYFYTAEGITGPAEYSAAKRTIAQIGEATALTVTERREEAQTCHRGVIEPLGKAILARMKKEGSEGEDANLGLGLAMYDYDIPEVNGRPAQLQTSMLSVFETGKWIVKTRVTIPKSEESYAQACNYGGLASVGLAGVITRQDAPAIADK